MRIVGLIGPSGTGKSYRAAWIAREKGLDFIIDDGILIKGNSIIAGKSAKREATKIRSIKCALFSDEDHADSVIRAIDTYKPRSILILGTSDKMIENIVERLKIKKDSDIEKLYIHQISTEQEITYALSVRQDQGKHVIPVPTFEIKKHFSGYFLDPLQIFRKRGKENTMYIDEKSVVRPTFSYLGKYTISDYTIYQIVEHVALSIKGIHKISRFRVEIRPEGILIDMDVILAFGYKIKELLKTAQINIKTEIERVTALNIICLNMVAKSLVLEQDIVKHN